MSWTSPVTVLMIIWAAITCVFIVFMILKSLAGMREEDVVILDPAESAQAEEQKQIIAKVERLTKFAKGFGIASLVLLLVTGAIWIYQGLTAPGTGLAQ